MENNLELTLDIDASSAVNYAMQQNDILIVRRLRILNPSPADCTDLTLTIISEPSFTYPWHRSIDRLPACSAYDVGTVDLALMPDVLARQREAVRGYLHVQLRRSECVLAERRLPIDVLAYDQWNGMETAPETLAAFVMPNHPQVETILRQAADILKSWTGHPVFLGYQHRDRRQVLLQAAAVYEAVRQLQIGYSGVPASFERTGQKIRTPDRILEARLANCLDLSTLFAACFEQIGLHPLIVIFSGHAFPGVWLVEETFHDIFVDDAATLRKRVDLEEIVVLEATLATEGSGADFSAAKAHARRQLDVPEPFVGVMDIRRARIGRIRPLPLRTDVSVVAPALTPAAVSEADAASTLPDTSQADSAPALAAPPATDPGSLPPTVEDRETTKSNAGQNKDGENTGLDRLERWKRKLLDLSLKNRLLNFRETKTTVPFLMPDLAALENALANGGPLEIHPLPQDWRGTERSRELYRSRTGRDAENDLILAELQQRRLRTPLESDELQRRLVEISRDARTSLEENGANTLYLALGMLAWYEPNSRSDTKRLAPILLIPVELQRRSVQSPFTLVRRDEEAMVNVTLLEMLREQFGIDIEGLDPLPEDDVGIDVAAVFRCIREHVKEMPRWDVEETAVLGLFSFTKFLMWRDLAERTEDLKKNKLVASLIHFPHQPFPLPDRMPNPDCLDDDYAPDETFCPLSADSSQLAAVYAAGEGKTFVLHGPPGTGKSQTIANIIAHTLAQGKTVLFVAEKMAALNVVQQRLARIGLGEFCLEVHSNKARKADVLRQLEETLTMAEIRPPEEWTLEAQRLGRLRQELNAYVRALHQQRETGDSFYTAVSRLIAHRDAPRVKLDPELVRSANADRLRTWRDQVKRLQKAGEAVGHPAGHPWQGVSATDWSLEWQQRVQEALTQALEALGEFESLVRSVAELAGLPKDDWSYIELDCMKDLSEAILSRSSYASSLVNSRDWNAVEASLNRWIQLGTERDALRREVYAEYTPDVLQLDLDHLAAELAEAEKQWVLPRWFARRRVLRALQSRAQPGRRLTIDQAKKDLDLAIQLRDKERELAASGDEARALLGQFWHDGEADWSEIAALRDWAKTIRHIAARLVGTDAERLNDLRQRWAALFTEHVELLQPGGAYHRQLSCFVQSAHRFRNIVEELVAMLSFTPTAAWGSKEERGFLQRLRHCFQRWQENLSSLRLWCLWQRERADAVALGLEPLVQLYEAGLPHEQLEGAFERSFYEIWTDFVLSQEEVLRRFSRLDHEYRIDEFRALDDHFRQLTVQLIRARLYARIPRTDVDPNQQSEISILRREIRKQRRHIAIRTLFNRIPNLLLRLKPCLLMSPISVAQYLEPSFPKFDLVIFDEASQVPTWDAVGAIARGKEAIIVGDPKQLPPTTFFERNLEIDDETPVEDLESILDDVLALHVPELHLRWHYRSRSESLIAFSNARYYNNQLLTFPAPETRSSVHLRYVAGQYDRGRSRTNRIEAEAVVSEVVRRLRSPEMARQSIGIVTFNVAQQRLIEDLLDEARRNHPEIEQFFDANRSEPVMVKNLENIQGDERDVILFSIGYGPDANGRISMDFGPLNREGGQRRLNVAVTRARKEIVVFSSLLPEQIDLSRTQAQGVRDLKLFLEYAQRGMPALFQETTESGLVFDSPFEEDVYRVLDERGYEVHTQVGSAGYRIDLAVVDPDNPGRYLLGIECDGATYHSAKNARDRDKLREAVLRDLGWQLHRIWSTDWWQDREGEIRRLLEAVEEARRRAAAVQRSAVLDEEPAIHHKQPLAVLPRPHRTRTESLLPAAAASVASPDTLLLVPQRLSRDGTLPVYTVSMPTLPDGARDLDFYTDEADAFLLDALRHIVREEGPISLNLLCQRLTQLWGLQRVTQNAVQRVKTLAKKANVRTVRHGKKVFYWPPDVDPQYYTCFRIHGDEYRRDAADLPPEEVANAILYVLQQHVRLREEEVIRETARLFGYQRTGSNIRERLFTVLNELRHQGRVQEERGWLLTAK